MTSAAWLPSAVSFNRTQKVLSRGDQLAIWRDRSFGVAWIIVAALGDWLRLFGGAVFLLCFAAVAFSAGKDLLRPVARLPMIFSAFAVVIVGLSYLHILPAGWTRFYDRAAIANQAGSVIAFGVFLVASQRWWERVRLGYISDTTLIVISVFAITCWPVLDFIISGDFEIARVMGTLRNGTMAFFVIASYFSFRGRPVWTMSVVAVLLAVIVSGRYYSQTLLTFLLFFLFLGTRWLRIPLGRQAVSIFVIILCGAALYGMTDPIAVWRLDANTGWRLFFWNDVLRSTSLTNGIGVGFGTEALSNYYAGADQAEFMADTRIDESFLLVGTHNAMMDTLLRLGVVGLVLFLLVLWTSRPLRDASAGRNNHTAFAFCIAVICLFTNVAIQSPLYAIGVAFALGYVRSTRSLVPAQQYRQRRYTQT